MNRFDRIRQHDPNILEKEMSSMDHSLLDEKAVLGLVAKRHENEIKPCFVMLALLPKGDTIPDDLEYDYGDCTIVRKSVDKRFATDRIATVIRGEEIRMPELGGIPIRIEGWRGSFVPSMVSWGHTRSTFPRWCYQGTMSKENSSSPYHDALAGGIHNPPYPSLTEALKHIFKLELGMDDYYNEPSFTIVVPDARARISEVGIHGRQIRVKVEDRQSKQGDLVVQAFASGSKFTTSVPKLEADGSAFRLVLDGRPDLLMITLCNTAGEVLDMKKINRRYRRRDWDPTVTIEDSKGDLKNIILTGEGQDVEFKRHLNEPQKFVDSVVSFSNGAGGKILVGVGDDGSIVGVDDPQSVITTINTWASQYCDPKPLLHAYHSKELRIVVVEVGQGNNKPYFMRERGCFIRQGDADVHASRLDVRHMMDKRFNPLRSRSL